MRWDLAKGDFGFKSKNNEGVEIDIYKYAGKESIIKECENSLKRLGTDYIDLYQIHWPESTTPIAESMEAVATLIKQGKVRHAGVCNYNAGQMAEAEKTISLVSNQIPFSMVNRAGQRWSKVTGSSLVQLRSPMATRSIHSCTGRPLQRMLCSNARERGLLLSPTKDSKMSSRSRDRTDRRCTTHSMTDQHHL
jgi:predicted oxidoreductase